MFNKTLLKNTILFLVLAELLSLTSFVYPTLNTVAFFVILLITLILSLKKLEWGLYIVLAELFIGSFGRLFAIEFDGTQISLRIGLFLIVLAVWLGRTLTQGRLKQIVQAFYATKLGKWYIALGMVLLWGVVWGLVRNSLANVFFDFNNWLYFLYILPFYSVFVFGQKKEGNNLLVTDYSLQITNVLTILAASVIILSLKTIALEWLFAHQTAFAFKTVYFWVRDFGIGEVTFFASNFYRVFMQSQIWLLLGFFIFLGLLVTHYSLRVSKDDESQRSKIQDQNIRIIYFILILSSTSLIISFSRSLWLGLAAGLIVFFLILLFKLNPRTNNIGVGVKWLITRVFKWAVSFLVILVLEFVLILAVINIPQVKDGGDLSKLLSDRLTQSEAASSSRLNQLKPLAVEIIKHPVIGSGFGTTVTYISSDPRIVSSTAGHTGEYTTFAFEWGFLDILLKLGLVGLVFSLLRYAWQQVKFFNLKFPISKQLPITQLPNFQTALALGLFLGLVALLVTNITTPYLNHPLGIGFVILMTVVVITHVKSFCQYSYLEFSAVYRECYEESGCTNIQRFFYSHN